MAKAALFLKWGTPFPGREQKSLEVFMAVQQFFGKLQSTKKIAAARAYLADTGNTTQFGGFMVIEGDVAQLRAVIDSAEYQDLYMKAQHLVGEVDQIHCTGEDEIPGRIQQLVRVRKELGIS